jgi:diguanylate cyclase (GGDEF)-like protein
MIQPSRQYVLIAVANLNRAATFRSVSAETLRWEVVLVRDGSEAVQEIARRGAPALLILDLSLPRVDGFAVLRQLRRQPAGGRTRVIAVAAHASLRAAARDLASTLDISNILPLDVDRVAFKEAVAAAESTITPEGTRPEKPAVDAQLVAFHAPPGADADEVVDRASVDIRHRFRMPLSVGYLKSGDRENLTLHVSTTEPDAAGGTGGLAEWEFLRQVAASSEPLVIPDVENHPVFSRLFAGGARAPRGFAAVPLPTSTSEARGALCVLDTKPLTLDASDVDALAALGRQVGQEIDRLFAEAPGPASAADPTTEDVQALQHMASTDPLTGLANRRGGEKHIANEISRAKRERRPLSCILIDIDRFKQVNDTFGHLAGDQVLRDISALVRGTVRAYDILVRWGGEEFLLVLPGVDLDAARILAERVRMAVEGLDTHGIGPVTISAGVAGFDSDYDFAATLRTTDRRLYQAKAAGRNCVV